MANIKRFSLHGFWMQLALVSGGVVLTVVALLLTKDSGSVLRTDLVSSLFLGAVSYLAPDLFWRVWLNIQRVACAGGVLSSLRFFVALALRPCLSVLFLIFAAAVLEEQTQWWFFLLGLFFSVFSVFIASLIEAKLKI